MIDLRRAVDPRRLSGGHRGPGPGGTAVGGARG